MNKLLIALVVFISIGIVSCETDIDVNADYKDIPVVYGLIDPSESNHYIKINKAFTGEGNALNLAADANNTNYAAGELDVTVDQYDGTTYIRTYSLTRTTNEIPKDPGIFDNGTNVLYKFTEPAINRNHTYKLKIKNNNLGKQITAETEIVKAINVSTPNINSRSKFWFGSVGTGSYTSLNINLIPGADVGRIQPILIFHYMEHYTNGDSTLKDVVMPLTEKQTSTTTGGSAMEWELLGETFFENIISDVAPPTSNITYRELTNFSLDFNVAGTELNTYMSAEEPSTSVNQDKPNYTNISEGVGIFSSREKIIITSSIDPYASHIINLHDNTIEYLESLNLGFCFGRTSWTNSPPSPCF